MRKGLGFGRRNNCRNRFDEWHVAVAGNPNSGKTSFFNSVTNGNHYVGNWPGVTVETVQSKIILSDIQMKIVDLPGTYSLTPDSEDQMIAGRYLAEGDIELILNVVDVSNLERNLYLTLQLIELGIPVVILLNKFDTLEQTGISIDIQELTSRLGVPIIPVSSISKKSVAKAMLELEQIVPEIPLSKASFPNRRSIKEIVVLEGKIPLPQALDSKSVDKRYKWIDNIVLKSTLKKGVAANISDKIDKIVLNRFLALPLFIISMLTVFIVAVNFGGLFIDFFDIISGAIFVDGTRVLLQFLHSPQWIILILSDSLGAGLQTVATFIPVIFFMFITMSILEDSGYMARSAFIADSFMKYIGLPGTAFVPLLVGFGCTVPAIMATRTLRNKRDRYMTIFMSPFMSCGARLPVYALLASALFSNFAGLVVFSIYLVGVLTALLTGLLLKSTLFKDSKSYFIMELPPYHIPRIKNVLLQTSYRLKAFLKKATLVMVIAIAVLGLFNSISFKDGKFDIGDTVSENTLLSIGAKKVTPIFGPMGIENDNWPATVSLFTGLFAKEAIISTINSIYGQNESSIRKRKCRPS